MANTKALHSFVSLPGKFGSAKTYAPTWGRSSAMHEHSFGDNSTSPLTPTSSQAMSLMKSTPTIGVHHTGMSIHYEMAPHDRRHFNRFSMRSQRGWA